MKTQQRFKSERHNVFAEEIIKIRLSSNGDKTTKWIDLIKTYAYGRSKWKGEIKCSNIIQIYKQWLMML